MDALTPPEPAGKKLGGPNGRIAAARAELEKAAQLGVLRGDPLRYVLEAVAAAFDAIDDVTTSLGVTGEKVAAAVEQVRRPIGQDILGPIQRAAAAGATEEVIAVARAIRWRTSVFVGAAIAIVALVALGTGLLWGRASAEAGFRTTQAGLHAAFQHSPKDAANWLALMRWNDIGDALRHCQAFTDQTSGRRACMVPLWIAPPQKRVPGA